MSTVAGLAGELAQAREAISGRLRGIDPADLAAVRRAYDAFSENDPMPANAVQSELSLGGVNCLGIMPPGSSGDHVIFWLHGGGYAMGSARSHKGLASQVASAAKCAAVIPEYRLAPEHRYPAALDDSVAAYKGILSEGVDPAKIILAGDSAGGGLAVATAIKLRAGGIAPPAGLMLLSPWVNFANTGWSWDAKAARDPFLTRPALEVRRRQYLGDVQPLCDGVAVLNADLRGLPPTIIQTGEAEVLLSDSALLAERLGGSGSPVTLEIWPDMFHVFQARYTMLTPARQAVDRLGAWAAAHLKL